MGQDELPIGAAVIGQSGGPTAVINQSLVGVVLGLRRGLHAQGKVTRILGMRNGVRGLTEGRLTDLTGTPQAVLDRVAATPSAALGSTRDKPDRAYCQRIFESCQTIDARYFFYIGGNDSSDTCRIVSEHARAAGYDLRCVHVPKTVDNDLVGNDHTPGFASAARFVVLAHMADGMDNAALPGIKINVVMGRHAGFLTAAAAAARHEEHAGPHLVYVPEVPFVMDRFVHEVAGVYDRLGRCHIAVSEGLQDKDGRAIGGLLMGEEKDAHGNVQLSGSGALGDQLAHLLKAKLTPKGGKPPRVRADTLGYLQRCYPDPSPVDAREARLVGEHAAALAARGLSGVSVTLGRESTPGPGERYACAVGHQPLEAVAAKTRHLPAEYLHGTCDVSGAFLHYVRPLLGELPPFELLE
ncbi:MAG: diphosphate--fructose-6-phosphate 1-phosphotransferase [Phycisphaeraceae bacterium]|nr:diphosphate--fructose-6-phosphate 1-phosphotransferase [Phycisphaeraceae bacterium]